MNGRQIWRCSRCRQAHFTAALRCYSCGLAGLTIEEKLAVIDKEGLTFTDKQRVARLPREPSKPVKAKSLKIGSIPRIASNSPTFDRLLGTEESCGAVPGSVVVLYGVPGSGKSTLLLQAFDAEHSIYYTGEESAYMLALRARSVGRGGEIRVMKVDSMRDIEDCTHPKTRVVIVDSIQAIRMGVGTNSAQEIRDASQSLTSFAQDRKVALFVVAHSTKEETMGGPQTLAHDVDVIVKLEVNEKGKRWASVDKNRFGESHVRYDYLLTAQGVIWAAET